MLVGLRQDHADRRRCSTPTLPDEPVVRPPRCAATSRRGCVERYGDRLDRPPAAPRDHHDLRWSTTWSTAAASRSSFRAAGGDRRQPRRDRPGLHAWCARSSGSSDFWDAIEALDNQLPDRRPVDALPRGAAGCSTAHPLAAAEPPGEHRRRRRDRALPAGVDELVPQVPELPAWAPSRSGCTLRAAEFAGLGVPDDLAERRRGAARRVLAARRRRDRGRREASRPARSAGVYFALSERFEVDRMLTRITGLPRDDRWIALARSALRYDLYAALAGADPATSSPRRRRPSRPDGADRRLGGSRTPRAWPGREATLDGDRRHATPSTSRPCRWRCGPSAPCCAASPR